MGNFEGVFIAASILVGILIAFFSFLWMRSDGLFRNLWLSACFLSLLFGFSLIDNGMKLVELTTPQLDNAVMDMTTNVVLIMMWCTILAFVYLVGSMGYTIIMDLVDSTTGRKKVKHD